MQKAESRTVPANELSSQSLRRRSWWKVVGKKRVPIINQTTMVECGAACLAMILSYYGRRTSVMEIRDYCNIGRDGLTALDIIRTARAYNLRVRAITLRENDFRLVPLPAIIHWNFNHFLVVERWTPKSVTAIDPAYGRVHISAQEFDRCFTGIVILLEPGVHFEKTTRHQGMSLRSYALNYVQQAPVAFLQIIGASLLLQIFGLAIPVLTKIVIDQVVPFGLNNIMTLLGLGMCTLTLAYGVTTVLRGTVLVYLQTRIDMRMMLNYFEYLLTLPLRFFQQRSSGDILARMSSNIAIRETISNQMVSTVLDGCFIIVYFIILVFQSPPFGLLVLGVGLLQILLLLGTNRVMHNLSHQELTIQGKAQGYMTEILAGITTIKTAGAEQRALEQWSNLFCDQMNASVRRNYISMLINTAISVVRTGVSLLLPWFGTWQVLSGNMSIGTMLALNALAIAFLTPLATLVNSGQSLQLIRSHLQRIADVVETEPEQDSHAVSFPPQLQGSVQLDHVSFRYDSSAPLVLRDITVNINAGQKVAIVGRTGSGKSTLGYLLLGMYLPTQGSIAYDEIPLKTLNYRAVRAQFGVVIQNASLFSGTIRSNIALGHPDASMEAICKVASIAAIHEEIACMTMGYETYVAEGGNALSGGQRQRLALARALLHEPALLLLDEATSALDVVTEREIEQNLRRLACTQIIIAHRLSSIRNADLILVLDQGTIVEQGTHTELIHKGGYYACLIQSQLANGELKDE